MELFSKGLVRGLAQSQRVIRHRDRDDEWTRQGDIDDGPAHRRHSKVVHLSGLRRVRRPVRVDRRFGTPTVHRGPQAVDSEGKPAHEGQAVEDGCGPVAQQKGRRSAQRDTSDTSDEPFPVVEQEPIRSLHVDPRRDPHQDTLGDQTMLRIAVDTATAELCGGRDRDVEGIHPATVAGGVSCAAAR